MADVFNSLPASELANGIGYFLAAIVEFISGLSPAYIFILMMMMAFSLLSYIFFSMRRIIENASK